MRIDPIDPNAATPGASTSPEAKKAAKAFESLFASFMLKSMRSTLGDNPLFPQSFGEKVYTDMLDNEYSTMMSDKGNLGIANTILKQLGKENGSSSLSALQSLKPQSWMIDNRLVSAKQAASADATAAPAAVSKWGSLISEAGKTYNVDPNLISAVIARESNGNPTAVSRAGAKGLMQLMDSTAQDLGTTNVWNPRDNIMAGTRYLRTLLDRFNGNEKLALASYNAGPKAVDQFQGVPPYPETQNYVGAVQRLKESFSAQRNTNKDVTDESALQ